MTFDHQALIQEGLSLLRRERTLASENEHGDIQRDVWCRDKIDGAEGIAVVGNTQHLPVTYNASAGYWCYDYGDTLYTEMHDNNEWYIDKGNRTWLRVAYRDGQFPVRPERYRGFEDIPYPTTYGTNRHSAV
jgi:hypothetical protein